MTGAPDAPLLARLRVAPRWVTPDEKPKAHEEAYPKATRNPSANAA
jgi:hypothetical protein